MKNIFKFIIPCMALALSFTSCNETMDEKAVIDAQNESAFSTPTVTITSATAPAYNCLTVNVSVADPNNVAEQGIQFSETNSFTMDDCIPNETVDASFSIDVKDLEEVSTYYVRAYAVGKNGKVVYTETQSVTTPEAPPVPLEGTYTASEYSIRETGIVLEGTYQVSVAFEEGSTEIVNITNIWDAGTTVKGLYDAETNTIMVPSQQLIYTDPTYGPLWLMGLTDDLTNFASAVTFTFKPRGGAMKSSYWACLITTGAYAGYTYNYESYLEMQHE